MSRVSFAEPSEITETDYSKTAASLVNNAINDAISMLEKQYASEFGFVPEEPRQIQDFIVDREQSDLRSRTQTPLLKEENLPKDDIPNIEWMTIDQFGKDAAEEKINEFITKTWKYEKSWLFCVDYLGEKEERYDMRYNFRVKWSIPTRRKPIPRATASVYFTYSVSKIKPGNYPVDVYYVFETNRLVHRPGKSRFKEKWLKDIIESKVQMYEAITF